MSKIAIVYKSKRGSTKKYAQWLAEETGADLFDMDSCKAVELESYDTIVYGGCIQAGGIQGIDFLKKHFKMLCNKEIIIFAVGLNVESEAAQTECREINLVKQLADLPCYFLPGAYDPAKVSGIDKAIMKIVKKMIGDSNPELRSAIENGADYVRRDALKPLVDAIHAADV